MLIDGQRLGRKIVVPLMFQNGLFKFGTVAPPKLKAVGVEPPFVVMASVVWIIAHIISSWTAAVCRGRSQRDELALPLWSKTTFAPTRSGRTFMRVSGGSDIQSARIIDSLGRALKIRAEDLQVNICAGP